MSGSLPARLLVVTAVPAERDALLAGLADTGTPAVPGGRANAAPGGRAAAGGIAVAAVGVGPAAAAAGTARLLALAEAAGQPYGAVLCAGIAGGFADRVPVGGLAVASACVAADLGATTETGFLGIDELGFGTAALDTDGELTAAMAAMLPRAVVGVVLTVSTVTGTAAGAAALRARHPGAVAEAMEGHGVAVAAAEAGVPFTELRAVSNPVGPRERAAWRIPQALAALTAAGAALRDIAVGGLSAASS